MKALLRAINTPDCPGVVLGMPASDTLKRIDQKRGQGEEVVSKSQRPLIVQGLWHAMTPQVFQLSGLIEALDQMRASGLFVTDEAQAMEATGNMPWLVQGLRSNISLLIQRI